MNEQIRNRIAGINQGKVPKGYKKVLNSTVFEDYVETTFGELFDFYGGLGIPRDQLSDNGYPYLHYGDMHRESFTKVSVEQYNELPKYDIKLSGNETFLLEDGDVVFLDASEDLEGTSRSVMVDNPENAPFISGLHTFIAREKNDTLAKDYKQYITMTDYVKKQFMKLASGFKVYGLNRNSIKDIVFAYPPDKQEQQKIAEILMKWDQAIALQEKLIEKLEAQKKALMQEVFKSHSSWEEVNFSDIYSMAGEGGTPSTSNAKYYIDGDIPFVKIEHLSEKYVYKIDSFITDLGMKNSGAWLIPINSLLYSNGATIGEISINRIPVTTKQGILGIVPNEKVLTEFLYYLMQSSDFKNKIKAITTKGTMPIAYLKDINNLKIKLPDIKQQTAISEFLSKIDQSINLRSKKVSALKLQQKSLMQLLLTGIVRV